jgi:hypothetical protein
MTPTTDTAAALIEKAIAAIPTLTHFGVGLYRPETFDAAATTAGIVAGQAQLRDAVHEVEQCVAWLSGVRPIGTVQRFPSSYTYKHAVMNWLRKQGRPGYVSNGAFVAAAVGLGCYPYTVRVPNVYFAFSSKRVRRRDATAAV